jgi:hypothetical protein
VWQSHSEEQWQFSRLCARHCRYLRANVATVAEKEKGQLRQCHQLNW